VLDYRAIDTHTQLPLKELFSNGIVRKMAVISVRPEPVEGPVHVSTGSP
jgi:hypothetical protein